MGHLDLANTSKNILLAFSSRAEQHQAATACAQGYNQARRTRDPLLNLDRGVIRCEPFLYFFRIDRRI